jgi:hypothetical protein
VYLITHANKHHVLVRCTGIRWSVGFLGGPVNFEPTVVVFSGDSVSGPYDPGEVRGSP